MLLVLIVALLFVFGYLLQIALINPFINGPSTASSCCSSAAAIILVNVQLIVFGPDAQGITRPTRSTASSSAP